MKTNKTIMNKELIESLESKIKVLKELQLKESNLYKLGKIQGSIDGFEYSLENIKNLPIWVPKLERIAHTLIGLFFGVLVGILIGLNTITQ